MSTPAIFLSAATLDLKAWRDILHDAFSRAGFRVITQDHSLGAAPGDVRALLAGHIRESDCVIHLAGLGYGAHARAPFPETPAFQCSWTQFEYYHAHELGKAVIAFVCAPELSEAGFQEKGEPEEVALKAALQRQHRALVASGHFEGTPLAGTTGRTLNEAVDSQAALLKAVAAAIGTLHRTDPAYDRVQTELSSIIEKLDRLSAKMDADHAAQLVALGTLLREQKTIRSEVNDARSDVGQTRSEVISTRRTGLWVALAGSITLLAVGGGIILHQSKIANGNAVADTDERLKNEARQKELAATLDTRAAGRHDETRAATAALTDLARGIDEKIDKLPSAPGTARLLCAATGAEIYSPVGLRRLGAAPETLARVFASDPEVIVSAPGRVPQKAVPPAAGGDLHVELPPAVLPTTGQNHLCPLLGVELVWVPSGSFIMGSPPEELGANSSERPRTEVSIDRGFWMASRELTNANAAMFLPRFGASARERPADPAEGVTWNEAVQFCEALTVFEQAALRLPAGHAYTLPTEAEWEYACRAGTATRFYVGDDETAADATLWHRENSQRHAHPGAQKAPNRLNLFDMPGNVEEWCLDWYGSYPGGRTTDPRGPTRGWQRVTRGGSYLGLLSKTSRSASRTARDPGESAAGVGFRIVLRSSAFPPISPSR